jgi:hypothetical protein
MAITWWFIANQSETFWREGIIPRALGRCHPSGFREWFQHLLESKNPSTDSPAVFTLDGQQSHTRKRCNWIAYRKPYAILNDPSHKTHRLQPVNTILVRPLEESHKMMFKSCLGNVSSVLSRKHSWQLIQKRQDNCHCLRRWHNYCCYCSQHATEWKRPKSAGWNSSSAPLRFLSLRKTSLRRKAKFLTRNDDRTSI